MFNFIFDFLHNYHPQPIIFKLGMFSIHWYGLLMSVAIIIGFYLTVRFFRKYNLETSQIWNLAFYLVIFGFIGARIYHILSEINYYWQRPLEIFYIWQGGLGVFGALMVGVLVLYFFSRKRQLNFWLMADILTPSFALGEAIVRWGNWFNQENFGQPTNLAWGIPIDWQNRPLEYISNNYFHPTFLYQSIWNLIIFVVLTLLIARWLRLKRGFTFGGYLILYSIGRFAIEFLRVDLQPIIFGLRLAQIMTILMFLLGIGVMVYCKLSPKNSQVIH